MTWQKGRTWQNWEVWFSNHLPHSKGSLTFLGESQSLGVCLPLQCHCFGVLARTSLLEPAGVSEPGPHPPPITTQLPRGLPSAIPHPGKDDDRQTHTGLFMIEGDLMLD